MTDTALHRMAERLQREFRPMTDSGDAIELADYQAYRLAEIIAEYVASVVSFHDQTPSRERDSHECE